MAFSYPSDWELSEQQQGDQLLITVAGPGTSFWSLGLFFSAPGADEVLQSALQAYQDEYPQLDIYEVEDECCGFPVAGFDVDFFSLELLSSASLRAFVTEEFTVLILFQADDLEMPESLPIFEQITGSLNCPPPVWGADYLPRPEDLEDD